MGMDSVLKDVRQYKLANADFIDWLDTSSDINDISGFLALPDKLVIGMILEYMHSKNITVLIGDNTKSLVKRKGYCPFKTILNHKGLDFIYVMTHKDGYRTSVISLIKTFFKKLNQQLEVL